MSFYIPPEKRPDPDFDWKVVTELKLLESIIFTEEERQSFNEELLANINSFQLKDTEIEVNYYSLGQREVLSAKS